MNARLPPTERLHTAREFTSVLRGGRSYRSDFLRIHFRPGARDVSRLGVVASRRSGNAVCRNRIKRRLREVFRRNKSRLDHPHDIVLVAVGAPRPLADYQDAFDAFLARLQQQSVGGAG